MNRWFRLGAAIVAMMMIARAVVEVLRVWDVRAVGELKGKSLLEMQYDICVLELTKLA